MASLAGMGVGGAVGGPVGALVGMGIPEYEAKRSKAGSKGGGVLLLVHCDSSEEVIEAEISPRPARRRSVRKRSLTVNTLPTVICKMQDGNARGRYRVRFFLLGTGKNCRVASSHATAFSGWRGIRLQ